MLESVETLLSAALFVSDFLFIWRNLFRNSLRAALIIVSVAIAFAIFGVLATFQRTFDAGQESSEDDRLVVVNKVNFTHPLPVAYFDYVRQMRGVNEASYAVWFGGYFQDPKNKLIAVAVEPETYMRVVDTDFDLPPKIREAFQRDHVAALVGQAMAQQWGWQVGDRIPITSDTHVQRNGSRTWDVTIVGIFDKRKPYVDTDRLIFRYDYFNETRAFGKDTIGWLFLRAGSAVDSERLARAIDQGFANSSYETTTDTEKAFFAAFETQFGNVAVLVLLVVGAALWHDPLDRREYDGDGGARTREGDRRAENARLLQRPRAPACSGRDAAAGGPWRRARASDCFACDRERAEQPGEVHAGDAARYHDFCAGAGSHRRFRSCRRDHAGAGRLSPRPGKGPVTVGERQSGSLSRLLSGQGAVCRRGCSQ